MHQLGVEVKVRIDWRSFLYSQVTVFQCWCSRLHNNLKIKLFYQFYFLTLKYCCPPLRKCEPHLSTESPSSKVISIHNCYIDHIKVIVKLAHNEIPRESLHLFVKVADTGQIREDRQCTYKHAKGIEIVLFFQYSRNFPISILNIQSLKYRKLG